MCYTNNMVQLKLFPRTFLLLTILCFLFSLLIPTATTFAADISKQASLPISSNSYCQGAIITDKYYIYTNWNKGANSFTIIRCDRSSKTSCVNKKTSGSFSGKPSSMYYKWGSSKAQAILRRNSGMYCIKISDMSKTSSCGSMLKSSGLDYGTDSYRQGWTQYVAGNTTYKLRGYGDNSGSSDHGTSNNKIILWKNGKIKKEWKVPLSGTGGEIEDVMVDGSGIVYFAWGYSHSKVVYYKVAKSVFNLPASDSSDNDNSGSNNNSNSNKDTSAITYDKVEPAGPKDPISSLAKNAKNDGIVITNLFGSLQDDEKGCGVYTTINLILMILSFGIVIAATIGLVISAITYMSSTSNEEQIAKAKKRILEIVIGLAIYAAMWSISQWLIPGGILNTGDVCSQANTSSNASTK